MRCSSLTFTRTLPYLNIFYPVVTNRFKRIVATKEEGFDQVQTIATQMTRILPEISARATPNKLYLNVFGDEITVEFKRCENCQCNYPNAMYKHGIDLVKAYLEQTSQDVMAQKSRKFL